jgi:hypothetical protein
MQKQKGFTLMEILVVLVIAIGGYGWINNLVLIMHSNLTPLTTELIIRFIGVPFMPLGAIMGYL